MKQEVFLTSFANLSKVCKKFYFGLDNFCVNASELLIFIEMSRYVPNTCGKHVFHTRLFGVELQRVLKSIAFRTCS